MDRQKLREMAEKEDWREKRKLAAVILAVSVAVFVAAVFLRPADLTGQEPEPELTQYQESYVDCPSKYLELCTKMSKIPTEEVRFQKAEDGKLYLEMPRTNRTLVARIQEGGSDGYLINIRD
ncbi:MAG: hypothetical protein ABEJ64_03470 [Candidatus Nanohaloarchaea archaeon]